MILKTNTTTWSDSGTTGDVSYSLEMEWGTRTLVNISRGTKLSNWTEISGKPGTTVYRSKPFPGTSYREDQPSMKTECRDMGGLGSTPKQEDCQYFEKSAQDPSSSAQATVCPKPVSAWALKSLHSFFGTRRNKTTRALQEIAGCTVGSLLLTHRETGSSLQDGIHGI